MKKTLYLFLLVFFIFGCDRIDKKENPCSLKVKELNTASKVELHVNGDDIIIGNFLTRHNINYSYDKFSNRYQGIIRGVINERGIDCAVVVYINVTSEGKYLSSEFVESYTGI